MLERLLQEHGMAYINVGVAPGRLPSGKFGLVIHILIRLWNLLKLILRYRPKRLAGSAAELTILGRLCGIPSFVFFEDDFEFVKPFARIAGPLATYLICPDVCSAWKWNHKKVSYSSYHELAYLHPNHFTPDYSRVEKIFDKGRHNFILRFSSLGAYHDEGKTGITDALAMELIALLTPHGKVFITSERELPANLESYRIQIPAADMHHALYYASLYIGDSQTMTAEAAVLGTPSIRFNDFAGKLGYLEDLEHRFQLTTGIHTSDSARLIATVKAYTDRGFKLESGQQLRNEMLLAKADFSKCMLHVLSVEPRDRKAIAEISETKCFQ